MRSPNCNKPTNSTKFLAWYSNILQSNSSMALARLYTPVSIAVELFSLQKSLCSEYVQF